MSLGSLVSLAPIAFVRWRRSRLEYRLGIRHAPSPCFSQRVRAEEEIQLDGLMRVAPVDPTQLGIEKVDQQPVDKLEGRALDRQDFASRQHSVQNLSVARPRVAEGSGSLEEVLHHQLAASDLVETASHPLDVDCPAGEGQRDQEEKRREWSKVAVGHERLDIVAAPFGNQAIRECQSNLQRNTFRPPRLERPQGSCRSVQLQCCLHRAGYVGDTDLPRSMLVRRFVVVVMCPGL